ncbi:MAG: c-type cytochrome [Deltaproteobacteria bacterium]|nr:c-type cytochrome [Deltaproteobacteria bacterium]
MISRAGGRAARARPLIRAAFLALPFLLGGCDYARMYEQEYVRTYEASPPEMDDRTVPVSGGHQLLSRADPKSLKNPLPLSEPAVEQGRQAYAHFCVHCHGPQADGQGTVGQSFAPLPTDLSTPYVQNQGDGDLFMKIRLGFGRHPPLATTVSEEDTWAVVSYIRTLKKG